jgi:AraC-like DNA-binding protein
MSDCFQIRPAQDLASIVDCIWEASPDVDTECEIIPDGSLELCFVLSDSKPDFLLFGPATKRSHFSMKGGVPYLGLRFRPGIGGSLFHESASVFADHCVSIRGFQEFSLEQLVEIRDLAQRRAYVESRVRRLLGRLHSGVAGWVAQAVARIEKLHGNLRIDSLAQHYGISQRQLERIFLQQVGVSPKAYARIVRIREASAYLKKHPSETGANVAALYGFTDQSHLLRDLRAFGL